MHVIGKDRAFLWAHPEYVAKKREEDRFHKMLKKLKEHYPLQYLIRKTGFYGLEFEVNPSVLIPRPETEMLVEKSLEAIKKISEKKLRIADIGTGSGAIIIALAKLLKEQSHYSQMEFFGTDISVEALNTATKNAKNNGVLEKIIFKKGDLAEPLEEKMDIIIANLPYISQTVFEASPTRAELEYEPKQALIATRDGLALIFKLLQQTKKHLSPNGTVLLEIGHDQGERVRQYASKLYPEAKIEIFKDFCNRDRVVRIHIKS
ncbi:MAG: release factor glutamine methyltransferase [Parcubacteria group bacterium Gr01-1014_18]|nr:MAG: release factor glutamine methyltransferase [Parcubacteria group bacterium Greene0416_36]TSC81256.1 MAG: release factor glutamine methyltransferase [Parcubacteria group bacterium Gr01-1014_18]TSC99278.1 MAG: release factor glutamine methyltransferase [Parcubacteria group bacterium Greene1014_20]TSD06885.1 MAG: release factor glutamine methyltransferase [Parcubacteria group bacterium Greene0714_2]